jgi:hypothetical protein
MVETGTPAPSPEHLTAEGAEIVQRIDGVLETLKELGQATKEDRDAQTKVNSEVLKRLDQTGERFNKIDRHLGYLRGAHAANVMRRNASLIADEMGYQVISELPQEELLGFSKMARDSGKMESDVRSFLNADLVIRARDANGHPAYIAIEASFTVANDDIKRAKRNAEYLHEFTGLPAKGAVAGVDIPTGRRKNAAADGVHCYLIPVGDLEAD